MTKRYTPTSAAADVEAALRLLEGRWKLVILFHLFGGKVMRFSDLERAIPSITKKMLGQQLKSMEADGIVHRTAYPQVPPKVEYRLIKMGPVSLSSSGWNPQMGRPASEQLRVRASCLIPGDSQSGSAKPHYMS